MYILEDFLTTSELATVLHANSNVAVANAAAATATAAWAQYYFGLSPGSSAAAVYNSCSETYQLPNASLFYILSLPPSLPFPFVSFSLARLSAVLPHFSY